MTDLGFVRLDRSSDLLGTSAAVCIRLGIFGCCEVPYLTGTMLMHRRGFYHDRKWRYFAAFLLFFSKKVRYLGKNHTPFYGVSLFDF